MIEQVLAELGLNDTEIAVYLAVVAHGRITPAAVARITRINRTTVYSTAKLLASKGLITEDLGATKTELVALPPEDITTLLDEERRRLETKEREAKGAIKELKKLARAASYSVPKISFIDEERLEAYLYKQSPTWSASIQATDPDKTWWGIQDHAFVEDPRYQEWIDWYWRESAPKDVRLCLLSNQSDIETEMKKRRYTARQIRFWPGMEATTTIWICGDYIVMIAGRSRPHYLVEIHDRVMADNLRHVFKNIWRTLHKNKIND